MSRTIPQASSAQLDYSTAMKIVNDVVSYDMIFMYVDCNSLEISHLVQQIMDTQYENLEDPCWKPDEMVHVNLVTFA
ncbi:hypothetical protein AVEN_59284-1 [Araneus ventricosus]|uniref:Uncharacterized protein n=1 Tax=Araneus ventricosus TaxID=182803 RepID=A0A4Y2PJE7_ARAVE|nr:hypothetical protein AVEN_59284-1 [Araneus ventricosus]